MRDTLWPGDAIKKSGKQMRSVWAVNTPKPDEKKYGKHPAQKPLELLRRVILASTRKGQTVLDPFTGSSTTGLVASLYGRAFIGIDREKKYLELSIKRFKDLNVTRKEKKLNKQEIMELLDLVSPAICGQ